MATIVTRAGKGGVPLTFTELDTNFTELNTKKIERDGSVDFTSAQSFAAGTAAAPSIRFVGATTTGWSAPSGAPTLSVSGVSSLSVSTNRALSISVPVSGNHTIDQGIGSVEIGFRSIPRRTTSGTLVAQDRGCCVVVSAGITIPSAVFSAGDAVTIFNNTTGNITLTSGGGLTMRQAGTTNTGNRTLGPNGIATIWYDASNVCIVTGNVS
jgi:hypothetical protein